MEKNTANRLALAILETLAESDDGTILEGYLYAGIETAGYARTDIEAIIHVLLAGQAIERVAQYVIEITGKGRGVVDAARIFAAARR